MQKTAARARITARLVGGASLFAAARTPAVAAAVAEGIPVIGYDRLIENADAFYLTFDNKEVGRLQAQGVFAVREQVAAKLGIAGRVHFAGALDHAQTPAARNQTIHRYRAMRSSRDCTHAMCPSSQRQIGNGVPQ